MAQKRSRAPKSELLITIYLPPADTSGVRIELTKESMTCTGEASPMANLMLSVMKTFAELEHALIREHQRAQTRATRQLWPLRVFSRQPVGKDAVKLMPSS